MAELPSSWGLTTRKNKQGKVEVFGKDDAGRGYKVRTCDSGELSDRDVSEIAAVDRERTTSKEFVGNLLDGGRRDREHREGQFYEDLVDAAGPVVHAGLERKGLTTGYSRAYARNFDRAFRSER